MFGKQKLCGKCQGRIMPMGAFCPKAAQHGAFVPGRGMSDYLIISSLGPEYGGLHLSVQCEYRDKRKRQDNGRFNTPTMRF